MDKQISTRIKAVMAAVLAIPAEEINENSSVDNIEVWDSLRHMNLVIALEEEFGITIPDEEVGNIVSFKLIETVVGENYV